MSKPETVPRSGAVLEGRARLCGRLENASAARASKLESPGRTPAHRIWTRCGRSRCEFAALSDIPGVRLISLQKGRSIEEIQAVEFGERLETLGDSFDAGGGAFLDSALATRSR
jgi:hypothetical protein